MNHHMYTIQTLKLNQPFVRVNNWLISPINHHTYQIILVKWVHRSSTATWEATVQVAEIGTLGSRVHQHLRRRSGVVLVLPLKLLVVCQQNITQPVGLLPAIYGVFQGYQLPAISWLYLKPVDVGIVLVLQYQLMHARIDNCWTNSKIISSEKYLNILYFGDFMKPCGHQAAGNENHE